MFILLHPIERQYNFQFEAYFIIFTEKDIIGMVIHVRNNINIVLRDAC